VKWNVASRETELVDNIKEKFNFNSKSGLEEFKDFASDNFYMAVIILDQILNHWILN